MIAVAHFMSLNRSAAPEMLKSLPHLGAVAVDSHETRKQDDDGNSTRNILQRFRQKEKFKISLWNIFWNISESTKKYVKTIILRQTTLTIFYTFF